MDPEGLAVWQVIETTLCQLAIVAIVQAKLKSSIDRSSFIKLISMALQICYSKGSQLRWGRVCFTSHRTLKGTREAPGLTHSLLSVAVEIVHSFSPKPFQLLY